MSGWRMLGRRILYFYSFAVFGCLCTLFMPIVIPLSLMPQFIRRPFQGFVRTLSYFAFVFVRWHCAWTGFAQLKLIDRTEGHYTRLFVANHLTMFDIVLIFSYFPRIQTLVNAKFLKNPWLWSIIKASGYITLRPNQAREGIQVYEELQKSMKSGQSLILFPEGTRSASGRLGQLKNGPFRLAADLHIPITPVYFRASQPFLNHQVFVPRQEGAIRLEAHIMPSLTLDGGSPEQLKSAFISGYQEFMLSFAHSEVEPSGGPSQEKDL